MKKSKIIVCGFTVVLATVLYRPAECRAMAPAKVPAKAATSAPAAPAEVPAKTPVSPAQVPAGVPAKAAAAAPAKAPVSPTQVPAKAAAAAPAKSPAEVPAKASVRSAQVPAKAAAGAPAKTPAGVPASTSSLESYHYNPAGKPDPFVPFIEKELLLQKRAEKKSSASIFPLQNANVDQFKLVGIAGDERRRVAIVEDERGKFYPLNEGTLIGRNRGKVKSILADRVIVEEKVGTDAGARMNRITIKLHKEDNEGKP